MRLKEIAQRLAKSLDKAARGKELGNHDVITSKDDAWHIYINDLDQLEVLVNNFIADFVDELRECRWVCFLNPLPPLMEGAIEKYEVQVGNCFVRASTYMREHGPDYFIEFYAAFPE